jgi:integrase
MNTFDTMAGKVKAYLNDRRQAGFALRIEGEQLERFARFADQRGHRGPLTTKLTVQWATAAKRPTRLTAARRLEVLRPFARYCQQFDAASEIPDRKLFGRAHRRLTPHIYSEAEIGALIDACEQLHPPGGLRGVTCAAIFGLIAATGLRISEATGLKRSDVHLDHAVLHIRHTKFGKSRWVPVHPTVKRALRRYVWQRDRDAASSRTDAFFVFDYGRRASTRQVQYAFSLLRGSLKWRSRGDLPKPRIHDLRHSFVCHRLERWYAQGLDINRNILALSTYIGHVKITDTYWYVTATPELLARAAARFTSQRGGVR